MADLVGSAVIELRADKSRLRRDIADEGKSSGRAFADAFRGESDKNLKGIGESFKTAGTAFGTILTVVGAAGPAVVAVSGALSAAASGAVALGGAIGPAAVAGVVAYGGAFIALKSSLLLVKFASGDLSKALTGDAKAMASLNAPTREFAQSLLALKPGLESVRASASGALFAGLGPVVTKLARNYFPLLRTAASETGAALNDVAKQGAAMADSGPFRRDFGTIAKGNAGNVRLFGLAGLQLGDALRSLLVSAQPLIRSFAEFTLNAAKATNAAIQNARASGRLGAFFERAGETAGQLGRILGNVAVGLFNVFRIGGSGAGKTMLTTLEGITAEFRAWTASDSGAVQIAGYFERGQETLRAFGRLIGGVSKGLSGIGGGQQLAPLIDQITRELIPPLTEFLRNASASGALSSLIHAAGELAQVFADLSAQDASLKAFSVTLGALARGAQFILEEVPGASKALGLFFVVLGARQAASLFGLGGLINSLGEGFRALVPKIQAATGAQTTASGAVASFSTNMQHATGIVNAQAAGLAASTTRFASLRAAARQAAGPAGILALVASSSASSGALRTLGRVAGAAAVGFSVAGPWGAAIGGLIGLLSTFRKQTGLTAEAQRRLNDAASQVAGTLNEQTGAITKATRAAANKALADNGVYDAARKLNIPLHDVLSAYLGNANAANRVGAAIKQVTNGVLPKHYASTTKNREAQIKAAAAYNRISPALAKVTGAIGSSNTALGKQRNHLQQQREAADRSTAGSRNLGRAFGNAADRADFLAGQARQAATAIHKIPEHHNTSIQVSGLATAINGVQRFRTGLDSIHDKTVRLHYIANNPSIAKPRDQRAAGGPVYAGRQYLVGERGPEPFVPAQAGRILSVAQAQKAYASAVAGQVPAGAGRGSVTIPVYLPTGDPEAAAQAVQTRLVLAGITG